MRELRKETESTMISDVKRSASFIIRNERTPKGDGKEELNLPNGYRSIG